MKAVLDTNVHFGGLMDAGSAPGRSIKAWRAGKFSLAVSPALLSELRWVLRWHKPAGSFVEELGRAESVDPPRTLTIPGISPGDNRVVEAALAAGADYIVSSDRALLALREFEGVAIVTPSCFLRILGSAGAEAATTM